MPAPFDRRAFLRRLGVGAATVAGGSALLASCERATPVTTAGSIELSSPPGPTWEAGRPLNRAATLRIYQWKEYLAGAVIRDFEARYDGDVRVQVDSFTTIDEAVATLQDPATRYDVFFPTIDALPGLIDQRLLQPLDHDLLPHLGNLWPWFTASDGPFYDPGQGYSVPYTVYSSGLAWRSDLVDAADAPDVATDPYGAYWNGAYRDRVGMYDDHLEALSMLLRRRGIADVVHATDEQLTAAADDLAAARAATRVRLTNDGVAEGLPEGAFALHQAWSGDVLATPRYAIEEGHGAEAEQLRYWAPAGPGAIVGCDLMAVCQRGRWPELAHAFIDHLLRVEIGVANFCWNGYQPPLEGVSRSAFSATGSPWRREIMPGLLPAMLDPEEFAQGQMLVGFGPQDEARWLAQWNRVASGT